MLAPFGTLLWFYGSIYGPFRWESSREQTVTFQTGEAINAVFLSQLFLVLTKTELKENECAT